MLVLSACGNGGGGGGGDEALALGKEALIEYTEAAGGGAPGATTTLGVTVLGVRHGTQEDLSQGGLEVDPEDRSATPYYVDVRYENQGQNQVTRNLDVSEGTLAPGESDESCTLTLVPEGADVAGVLFVSQGANAEIMFKYWDAD